jgi:C-terminal processing protease CtpA/Prc
MTKEKEIERKDIIKKINNGLKRKNKEFLKDILERINKKKEKDFNYTVIPAVLKIEGKKYHIQVFQRELKDYQNTYLLK